VWLSDCESERERERERDWASDGRRTRVATNERLNVVVQWVLVIGVMREREREKQIDIASSTRALIMSPQSYWRA